MCAMRTVFVFVTSVAYATLALVGSAKEKARPDPNDATTMPNDLPTTPTTTIPHLCRRLSRLRAIVADRRIDRGLNSRRYRHYGNLAHEVAYNNRRQFKESDRTE